MKKVLSNNTLLFFFLFEYAIVHQLNNWGKKNQTNFSSRKDTFGQNTV